MEQQREDGTVEVAEETVFFNLVDAVYGNTRDKVVHTVCSADETRNKASIAFHVQFMDRWTHEDLPDDGALRIFAEADLEWVLPSRIATFDDLARRMHTYGQAIDDPAHVGTLVLSDRRRAKPTMSVMDASAPVALVEWALRQAGWEPVLNTIEHVHVPAEGSPKNYDGRSCLKMKWYFQTLLTLETCLPLARGSLPSQEPVHFYRLLLRGDFAQAGLSSKTYVLAWNRGGNVRDEDLVALAAPPEPLPLQDGVESFGAMPLGMPDPVPKRRAGPSGPRRPGRGPQAGGKGGGGGRGSGSGGGDPPPVDPPPPLPPPDGDEGFAAPPLPEENKKKKRQLDLEPTRVQGLNGCDISFVLYITTSGKFEPHYKCHCFKHGACCEKRKGKTLANQRRWGRIQPIAFLHAWHAIAFPSDPKYLTHAQEGPTDEMVDAWAADHREEFEQMLVALDVPLDE